jgi:hypothetical protein
VKKDLNMRKRKSIPPAILTVISTLIPITMAYSKEGPYSTRTLRNGSPEKASGINHSNTETKEQRDARIQWWRQARFGLFVHWGLYSGEAIFGTTASPFERPGWGRFTKKPGKLYAHVFQWPRDGTLEVPVSSPNVTRAYLLADTDRTSLKIDKQPDALLIHVPQQAPDEIVSVVAIEYQE